MLTIKYNTTRLSFLTNTKDLITKLASSFVVYQFFAQDVAPITLEKQRKEFGKGLINMDTVTRTS